MPSPNPNIKLINTLESDYPHLTFKTGPKFAFKAPKTITTGPPHQFSALLTLHELAHAILKHKNYSLDIQRLKMERDAWSYVQSTLCPQYSIPFDEDFAQNQLDTYRDWLHKKSLCKTHHVTRYQDPTGTYHCPLCP